MFSACGEPIHIGLSRTTDAVSEWCTSAEAKNWLKVDDTTDDTAIGVLISATRNKVESDTSRGFLAQTWTYSLDKAPANRAPILLPVAPVTAITSITSYSEADASSTVATSVYRLDTTSVPARVVLKDGQDWPSGLRPQNALVIVFTVGYSSSATIPVELTQAARLLLAHWYANREAVQVGTIASVNVPLGYEALIAPYRVPWL